MSKIRMQHGRKSERTEYYEWRIVTPKVVIQKYGERWMLAITHTDGTWQVAAYFDDLPNAKEVALRLAQRYASAKGFTVSDYVRCAKDMVDIEYAHLISGQPPAALYEPS